MRNPRAGTRKNPHLLLAKSPEFSSPPGEGKARRPFEEIDTAHPLLEFRNGIQREGEQERPHLGGEEPSAKVSRWREDEWRGAESIESVRSCLGGGSDDPTAIAVMTTS